MVLDEIVYIDLSNWLNILIWINLFVKYQFEFIIFKIENILRKGYCFVYNIFFKIDNEKLLIGCLIECLGVIVYDVNVLFFIFGLI